MSRVDLVERYGVALEQWQWDSLDGELPKRLKRLALQHEFASFVYFIVDGAAVKIGIAGDPEQRLASLQTGNPRKLAIEQLIVGDGAVERRWHRVWGNGGALIRDEWFNRSVDILSLAERVALAQVAVLERGTFIETDLARCIDDAFRNHGH